MYGFRIQHVDLARPHRFWMRCLAAFVLLLASSVMTAQAAHIHGDLLPHSKAELHKQATDKQALGGEERCPLCMAVHTTLPPRAVTYVAVELLSPTLLADQAEIRRAILWHSTWFSRPPPQTLS